MNVRVVVLIILIISSIYAESNNEKFLVYFNDKPEYNAMSHAQRNDWIMDNLSSKVLNRRLKRGNGVLWDEKDFPVSQNYIEKVSNLGAKIIHVLKWQNAISVSVPSVEVLDRIKAFTFVTRVEKVKSFRMKKPLKAAQFNKINRLDPGENLLNATIRFIKADTLHQLGYTGEGITIGVFDTGFETDHPVLANIISRLVGQYDFVDNDNDVSGIEESHGTFTSSVIGGYYQDSLQFYSGLALNASFILCRTEYEAAEIHAEEDNWAAAAEYAESLGVDLISTSLGYSEFDPGEGDYTYEDMDGKTTIITQAANALTERGVVLVVAAGNEGNKAWHYITAPSDGYDVISVGAIGLDGKMATFSSYGPTYDGRIKPEIVAPGVAIPGANDNSSRVFAYASGTSMACPVAAGGIALILQAYQDLPISTLRAAIMETADITNISGATTRPGDQYGFGVLNIKKIYDYLRDTSVIKNEVTITNETLIGPNPFNISRDSRLAIAFNNTIPLPATVAIYNVLGQKLMEFKIFNYANIVPADQFRNFNAGIYFLKIEGKNYKKISKMVITR